MKPHALVTGSDGFIGRHFTTYLRNCGWLVQTCDLKSGHDANELFALDESRYDLVVHAAYHVGGRAAIEGNPLLLAKNLELDAHLFDWAVRTGQSRVLYFSSSAAYPIKHQGMLNHLVLRESIINIEDVDQPDANYGWAKLTGERLARNARERGLTVHVVRPFSGYGEDQGKEYPFRAIGDRAQNHENPFEIWGTGHQVRDWIHVDDVIAGCMAIVESGFEEPVNLCTGTGTSMRELAQLFCDELGFAPKFNYKLDAPTGVMYRVGDPSLFHRFYEPRISLREGVQRALSYGG